MCVFFVVQLRLMRESSINSGKRKESKKKVNSTVEEIREKYVTKKQKPKLHSRSHSNSQEEHSTSFPNEINENKPYQVHLDMYEKNEFDATPKNNNSFEFRGQQETSKDAGNPWKFGGYENAYD